MTAPEAGSWPTDGVVTLRPWRVEDAPFYLECCRDPESRRFTTDPPQLSLTDVQAAIEALPQQPTRTAYLVVDAATGEPRGHVATDRDEGVVSVSYVVAPGSRGQGVATRALRLAAAAAGTDPSVTALCLWTHEANVASRRVAERAGFLRDLGADRAREVDGRWWPTVGYIRVVRGVGMGLADVVDLHRCFVGAGVRVWLDGGWGVDALLGRQTRHHGDLDIALESRDLPVVRTLLGDRGHREKGEPGAQPWNFVLADDEGREVDLHVVELDQEGNGILGPVELGAVYPARSLLGRGVVDGHPVHCIAAEDAVAFHSGYPLRRSDCHDVLALCEAFDLPVPDEVATAWAQLRSARSPG